VGFLLGGVLGKGEEKKVFFFKTPPPPTKPERVSVDAEEHSSDQLCLQVSRMTCWGLGQSGLGAARKGRNSTAGKCIPHHTP